MKLKIKLAYILTGIFLMMVTVRLSAQGVRFENNASWEQVLKKAKEENKYIFLDCYATWCAPCKYMSANVFTAPEAGEYFNQKFINVKLQMDRTKSDPAEIKARYSDAGAIEAKYMVQAYPTYLVFTPDGKAVHRIVGATQTAGAFIKKVNDAFDPSKQYFTLVNEYKNHRGDSAYLRHMIQILLAASDKLMAAEVGDVYLSDVKDMYSRDNLSVVRSVTISSKNKGYQVFTDHSDKIDAVYGKNFSKGTISRIMYEEVLKDYFNNDVPAPDWSALMKQTKKTYPLLTDQDWAMYKYNYYRIKHNIPEYEKTLNTYMDMYGEKIPFTALNEIAWDVFMISDNRALLQRAVEWSKKSLDSVSKEPGSNYVNYLDTYANLQYKLGNTEEAINTEKKLLDIATKDKKEKIVTACSVTLAKMEKGEKTWN